MSTRKKGGGSAGNPAWRKGVSGNPAGRKVEASTIAIREAFKLEVPETLRRLCQLRDDPDSKTAVAACKTILDHALPKLAPVGDDGKTSRLDELVAALRGDT